MPLGLLLLSRGQVTDSQLRAALQVQSSGGRGRIGKCLIELGFVRELQVTAALGAQWACPVFPGLRVNSSTCDGILPLPLLENFRMLPVQFVAATRILYIAFGAEDDYAAQFSSQPDQSCKLESFWFVCLAGSLQPIPEHDLEHFIDRFFQYQQPR